MQTYDVATYENLLPIQGVNLFIKFIDLVKKNALKNLF